MTEALGIPVAVLACLLEIARHTEKPFAGLTFGACVKLCPEMAGFHAYLEFLEKSGDWVVEQPVNGERVSGPISLFYGKIQGIFAILVSNHHLAMQFVTQFQRLAARIP